MRVFFPPYPVGLTHAYGVIFRAHRLNDNLNTRGLQSLYERSAGDR